MVNFMMEVKKLIREVKKHKKWFEDYGLNPFAYEVNNHKFYLAVYKRNNKEKGNAIISLDSNSKQEHMEAFPWLVTFTSISANIFNIIGTRSKISPNFFFDHVDATREYIRENQARLSEESILIKGMEIMNTQGQWQQELVDLYQEYEDYYDNGILKKNIIKKNDIDYTLTILGKTNMLQFKQGKYLFENLNIVEKYRNELINKGINKSIPEESNKFLKGLLSNDKYLEKSLKEFTFEEGILHLPYEEQLEKMKRNTHQSALDLTEKLKRTLRHPTI